MIVFAIPKIEVRWSDARHKMEDAFGLRQQFIERLDALSSTDAAINRPPFLEIYLRCVSRKRDIQSARFLMLSKNREEIF